MKKALVLACLVLAACSDPYKAEVPTSIEAVQKNDSKFTAVIEKLPQAEREKVAAYIVRQSLGAAFGKPAAAGVTVRQAIDDQTAFEAEQARKDAEAKAKAEEARALAEKVKAEKAARQKQADDAVTVAVANIKIAQATFSKNIDLEVAFQNKTAKDLAGVKGVISFTDAFGKRHVLASIDYEKAIKANAAATWQGSRMVNTFDDGDRKLEELGPDKVKFTWEPHAIAFSDGSKIVIEDL